MLQETISLWRNNERMRKYRVATLTAIRENVRNEKMIRSNQPWDSLYRLLIFNNNLFSNVDYKANCLAWLKYLSDSNNSTLSCAFSYSNFSHVPYIRHQANLSLITSNHFSFLRGFLRPFYSPTQKDIKASERDKRQPCYQAKSAGNRRNETIRRAVFFTDHLFYTGPTRFESDTPTTEHLPPERRVAGELVNRPMAALRAP